MDNSNKYINNGLDWALSDDARRMFQELLDMGIDFDLAYAIMENELSEDDLYDLPPRGDDDEAA